MPWPRQLSECGFLAVQVEIEFLGSVRVRNTVDLLTGCIFVCVMQKMAGKLEYGQEVNLLYSATGI